MSPSRSIAIKVARPESDGGSEIFSFLLQCSNRGTYFKGSRSKAGNNVDSVSQIKETLDKIMAMKDENVRTVELDGKGELLLLFLPLSCSL